MLARAGNVCPVCYYIDPLKIDCNNYTQHHTGVANKQKLKRCIYLQAVYSLIKISSISLQDIKKQTKITEQQLNDEIRQRLTEND